MTMPIARRERAIPRLAAIHTVAFDFDGVFTDNKVWVDQDGRECVRCDRGDGLALDLVRAFQRRGRLTAEFFILSREHNPVVLARARKLRLACHQAIGDKLSFIQQHLAARFPNQDDTFAGLVYVGNDPNDLPVMRRAGHAVAPADAHPTVRAVAHLVLSQSGGEGCVREFVKRLLRLGDLSVDEIEDRVLNG
jgi:3-deoxy-D-manno-octulosonate 8-phosphate phosphatase (KDO 8-P phosphatase)